MKGRGCQTEEFGLHLNVIRETTKVFDRRRDRVSLSGFWL